MRRHPGRSILIACMLVLGLALARAAYDGGSRRFGLSRFWPAGQESPKARYGIRMALPQGWRAVANGRFVTLEREGNHWRLGLPAAIEKLEPGASPGAELTITTKKRSYALGLKPKPRVLYSYPRTSAKNDIIIIEKALNMLYLYRDGELKARYPVATGKQRHFTPEGVFYVAVKLRDPEGPDEPSAQLGSRWMGLAVPEEKDRRGPPGDTRAPAGQKYGIHGTSEPESIGSHASAGCVRLHNADVVRLYDQVAVGTTVEIRP